MAHDTSSLGDLLMEIEPVGSVVGARYHNEVSGRRLCKPKSPLDDPSKHDALMNDMGVRSSPCRRGPVSASQLIERFSELQSRSSEVHTTLTANLDLKQRALEEQFMDLAALIDSGADKPLRPDMSRSLPNTHSVSGGATP